MIVEKLQDDVKVTIAKEFAIKEAAELREKAYELIDQGSRSFMMDFSNCEFIDSSGLGVLVSIYKRCAEKGGTVRILHMKPQVMKIFQLTRLDKVFDIQ